MESTTATTLATTTLQQVTPVCSNGALMPTMEYLPAIASSPRFDQVREAACCTLGSPHHHVGVCRSQRC